jgi:hypothetical protein
MKLFTLSLGLCLVTSYAVSQGCSDAGFCTMGAMKPDQHFSKKINLKLNSMEVSFYRATTTLTPIIKSVTTDLNFSLNSRNTFQVKLPYQWVDGTLGSTAGLGDISLCFTRNLLNREAMSVNLSVGAKIPTNKSNKESADGFPMPMYYQTSLGTYDGIAGISVITRRWLLATGIQMPFNENQNQFLWGAWNGSDEDPAYIERYDRAKRLKRGTDVMLRAERNFRFSRLNFSIGLLPIYRITRDEFETPDGSRIKPEDAMGLALSGIATVGYSFRVRNGVKLLVGHKIIQRHENPDGLTRELVMSATYFYRF